MSTPTPAQQRTGAGSTETHVHDYVAVGLGPFNLGLAALSDGVRTAEGRPLDGVVLEARDTFAWHPGLMLPTAELQVPFMADLVTMADPTSRWSFLNWLKQTGRLYAYYIRESFYPLRREYDAYCRWVAESLAATGVVRFGQEVVDVEFDAESDAYLVRTVTGQTYAGRHLVLGTGTSPHLPPALADLVADSPSAVHSCDHLLRRADLVAEAERTGSITVIGSGQSAAEIYLDLLTEQQSGRDYTLTWLTRSPRFFPLEYTKLTLEMTSPEWTAHFQGLDQETRDALQATQQMLHKGISSETIDAIHEALYVASVDEEPLTTLLTATEVVAASVLPDGTHRLTARHQETGEAFHLDAGVVIAATGYRAVTPGFVHGISDRLRIDERGRYTAGPTYAVDHEQARVFVQNGEEHTHGFVAPDLGMGAFRNSVLLREIVGHEVYPVEERIAFQEFGVPDRFRRVPDAAASRSVRGQEQLR